MSDRNGSLKGTADFPLEVVLVVLEFHGIPEDLIHHDQMQSLDVVSVCS